MLSSAFADEPIPDARAKRVLRRRHERDRPIDDYLKGEWARRPARTIIPQT
jgi:hypothetical protein